MNLREVSLLALIDIEEGGYANLVLKNRLLPLPPLDKNLATNIVYGVLRHRTKLDFIIQQYSNLKLKKLSKYVINILCLSAYQVVFLDKIPNHTAVDEGVKLAKKYAHRQAVGFVNAVLRKVSQSSVGASFMEPVIEYSHPQWLIDMWQSQYGEEKTLEILKANQEFGGVSYRDNDEIQGKSSQKAIEILSPQPDDTIIDVCSAPGGKALYMAELMEDKGEIIACDVHPHRVELIRKNAERKNLSIIKPTLNDGTILNENWLNYADEVLVDAPCSGLGLIHKKPDIKWSKTFDDIKQISLMQKEILDISSNYVKQNGFLMYCTCTINKIENEQIIENFLKTHQNFSLLHEEQIFPSKDFDGFYIAKLLKSY